MTRAELIRGEIAAVSTSLGMIAVALAGARTRRFILPLAGRSTVALRDLLDAAARRATVELRVRGAALLAVVSVAPAVPAAA